MSAPDPIAPSSRRAPTALRPGDVVMGWRWVLAIGWVGIIGCLMIVAGAGEVTGRAVWWFGPDTERQSMLLMVLPFVLPVAVVVMASQGARYVVEVSALATVSVAVTAWIDRDDAPGAAAITALVALAGLLVTLAALAGRARRAPGRRSGSPELTD
jgi:hypothetical protein